MIVTPSLIIALNIVWKLVAAAERRVVDDDVRAGRDRQHGVDVEQHFALAGAALRAAVDVHVAERSDLRGRKAGDLEIVDDIGPRDNCRTRRGRSSGPCRRRPMPSGAADPPTARIRVVVQVAQRRHALAGTAAAASAVCSPARSRSETPPAAGRSHRCAAARTSSAAASARFERPAIACTCEAMSAGSVGAFSFAWNCARRARSRRCRPRARSRPDGSCRAPSASAGWPNPRRREPLRREVRANCRIRRPGRSEAIGQRDRIGKVMEARRRGIVARRRGIAGIRLRRRG